MILRFLFFLSAGGKNGRPAPGVPGGKRKTLFARPRAALIGRPLLLRELAKGPKKSERDHL